MTTAAKAKQSIGSTNLWKATLSLGLAILLTRATNFFTQIVIAHQFGAGSESDTYFVVENIMLLLSGFVVTGFSVAFIPLWIEYLVRDGEQEAQRFSDAFISFASVATLLLAVLIFIAAPPLVFLAAPGFAAQPREMAVQLLRTITPAIAFLGFTSGCTGLLQANRRFVIPELSFMTYNLVVLLSALTLAGSMGIRGLAVGIIVGAGLRLVVQYLFTIRLGPIHWAAWMGNAGVKLVQQRVLPIFLAYSGIQVTILVSNVVASGLAEGAVSGLVYAGRVMLLPIGLLALPLQTTIFPTLSQQAAQSQFKKMGETIASGLGLMSFATIPASAGIILLKAPLIQLLYQRGAFDAAAAALTSDILGWYALSLPGIAGMMLINSIYCALGKPGTLVWFNLFNWGAIILMSLVLLERFAASGIALSISLTTLLTWTVALWVLKRRLPEMRIRALLESIFKALLSTTLMAAVLLLFKWLIVNGLSGFQIQPALMDLILILSMTCVGVAGYGLAAILLRMDEVQLLVHGMRELVTRRGEGQ